MYTLPRSSVRGGARRAGENHRASGELYDFVISMRNSLSSSASRIARSRNLRLSSMSCAIVRGDIAFGLSSTGFVRLRFGMAVADASREYESRPRVKSSQAG
jgi:hypothetical protein